MTIWTDLSRLRTRCITLYWFHQRCQAELRFRDRHTWPTRWESQISKEKLQRKPVTSTFFPRASKRRVLQKKELLYYIFTFQFCSSYIYTSYIFTSHVCSSLFLFFLFSLLSLLSLSLFLFLASSSSLLRRGRRHREMRLLRPFRTKWVPIVKKLR